MDNMLFGKTFPEVHRWLDGTFKKWADSGHPYMHWIERHNTLAIALKFDARSIEFLSARHHVLCDWMSHWGIWLIPENQIEVTEFLKTLGKFDREALMVKPYKGVKE